MFDFIYMKFKKQVLEVRIEIFWGAGYVLLTDLGAGYTGICFVKILPAMHYVLYSLKCML